MTAERQLGLFRSSRQRGQTVRVQASEFELHCAIADTIRVSLNKGWLWFHVPNGGWRTKVEAAKFTRMGVKPGVPDLILIAPDGRHYYLEIKTKYGRLTHDQIMFGAELDGRGLHWQVAWNYKEAIDILRRWGAVRVKI